MVTPYLVENILDNEGNITYTHTTEVKRQVISSETASLVADMLEKGVSGDGGAKNAAVEGYLIAAKTGTSEKFDILDENGNSYLRIGSCVGFAPSNGADIAILIVVDEPTTAKYGSMVAAPYVGDLMEMYLPYLGHDAEGVEKEDNYIVGAYIGADVKDVSAQLKKSGMTVEIIGDGNIVQRQMPIGGTEINRKTGRIILYTENSNEQYVTMPSFIGQTPTIANQWIVEHGLNLIIEGVQNQQIGVGATVVGQSISPGTKVKKGTVVTLTFLYTDNED